ncbi:hypothetical protein MJO47_11680 [Desulfuromonas sp. KJ2020]|uniref:cytochrome c3 family protein n=1 Tax=Desulfuromonas sp. KJ2020 TaxID=2919173 RepID=UPI0020A74EE9|nr:cytochrome c3 family protein [Desulfuromonas sp. KJ2020]MCP3177765.1 hypothetical protein [Desulfuromonas sp. KJ2020]
MKYLLPAVLLLAGVLFGAFSASTWVLPEESEDDQCIRCHVDTFNEGMAQKFTHPPFFERQCRRCHLAGGSPRQGIPVGEAGLHARLREPQDLTIEVCLSCHSDTDLGASHPVRLYARRGSTIIPEELPTIEDGMMTCVTCHGPHGAPARQLVREIVKTKLCVTCHIRFKNSSPATMF